ncbi:MAG: pyridoxal-dependent decarboxylase [Thermoflexales bacterium]|nr:pyridoxal-dependent decarboxylase [Thermoflexales bacterium]MDW8351900.1 pyridoxal-dependent decarboxylase [Anaerolineae bacterium]
MKDLWRAHNASHASDPLTAWFLGPKSEHSDVVFNTLTYIFQDYVHWRRNYFPKDPVVLRHELRREHESWQNKLSACVDTILSNLKADYPFYSPRYIAHMTSEQTIPAVLGYFAGMLYNPNNVTDEAAPVTVRLELEVGRMVAAMLGYAPERAWAHICSGGTVANLEALWVARMVQFTPFMVRDYCKRHAPDFTIQAANGQPARVVDLSPAELIHLPPDTAISLLRALARYEVNTLGRSQRRVLSRLNEFVRRSAYNVKLRGFDAVVRKAGMRPVIFASAAAHYCLFKVMHVLGYGEDCLRAVPVNRQFRIDTTALRAMLDSLDSREYVAAVIGVVGTTEEGAVDPIHTLSAIRAERARTHNQSFWIHADAAWGGYIRALFCGHDIAADHKGELASAATVNRFRRAIAARDVINPGTRATVAWDDPEVYRAFLALPLADSIVVDPHKLGHVPYPAGVVAFKNGLVTELMTQHARYISEETEGVKAIDAMAEINAVGPYILEGSKPGAAATACWLAHTTIPLDAQGHGSIMRASVLSARKLYWHLAQHRANFQRYEANYGTPSAHPFAFIPLCEPDTNIVCFIARPMVRQGDAFVPAHVPLAVINQINRRIHEACDIPKPARGVQMPYDKEYFVSRTVFEPARYSRDALLPLLRALHIDPDEYAKSSLVVLRSTAMNPLYPTALEAGMDYLADFVRHLHKVARLIVGEVMAKQRSRAR